MTAKERPNGKYKSKKNASMEQLIPYPLYSYYPSTFFLLSFYLFNI